MSASKGESMRRFERRPKGTSRVRRKPNPDFMKPLQPSEALGAVVGHERLPRTQVVKRLWPYIREHDLQDIRNRPMINAGAKLRAVLNGKDQVSMFEMTKLVNRHLSVVTEEAAEAFRAKTDGDLLASSYATLGCSSEVSDRNCRKGTASSAGSITPTGWRPWPRKSPNWPRRSFRRFKARTTTSRIIGATRKGEKVRGRLVSGRSWGKVKIRA